MHPDYWQERWRQGQVGFHQGSVTPLLQKHWPGLQLPPASRIFVPLCGKSLDMAWFAARGHHVLGVEISQRAVEQFFAEQELTPQVDDSPLGRHYRAGNIEIICGDAFALDAPILADCNAVYDRAALIALPPDLRRRYVRELHAHLPSGCRGLLITLEYPRTEMDGPPFSIPEHEVRKLYGEQWNVDLLERRAILAQQPRFIEQGLTALDTVIYRLSRH